MPLQCDVFWSFLKPDIPFPIRGLLAAAGICHSDKSLPDEARVQLTYR